MSMIDRHTSIQSLELKHLAIGPDKVGNLFYENGRASEKDKC